MGSYGNLWGAMGTFGGLWGVLGILGTYGGIWGLFLDFGCLFFSQLFHVGLIFSNPCILFLLGGEGSNFLHTHFDTNPPPPLPPSIKPISDI